MLEFFIIPWKAWDNDMSIVLMIGIIANSDNFGQSTQEIDQVYFNPEENKLTLKPTLHYCRMLRNLEGFTLSLLSPKSTSQPIPFLIFGLNRTK